MMAPIIHLVSFVLLFTLAACHIPTPPPENITSGFIRHPTYGDIQVSWFHTGNLVAYEGDVVYGTVKEFNKVLLNVTYTSGKPIIDHPSHDYPSRKRDNLPAPSRRSNSLFPGSSSLWAGGVIRYRYFNDSTEATFSSVVNAAIAEWTSKVPCIRWVKEANNNSVDGAPGVVTIYGQAGINYCLASHIGNPGVSLWMVLTPGGCGPAEVLHEWGHLIGLIHEQKRPDAYLHTTFLCPNLMDYPFNMSISDANRFCCGPPGGCCGFACQFTPQQGDYNIQDAPEDGGAFDLDSIMMYRRDSFAKPGTFTLSNGPNDHVNPQHLSSEDINRVRELYLCPAPKPPKCSPGCNPHSNRCSIPTAQTCVYPSPNIPNPRAGCACRAGYKASAANGDTTKHWRLPAPEGNFRVWVAEGVPCDTLCDFPYGATTCQEVTLVGAECLHL